MIRALATTLVLASGWSLTDVSLDRLRWNTRERTATGITELEAGSGQKAVTAFETAARLDPADPLLRFNAGSAQLLAGGEGALEHLETAAASATGKLGAQANYNLGNAKLAGGDAAGAIEAYESSLRLNPDHEEAKFNLEVALQQQQQQQQQQDQNGDQQDQQQQDQSSDQNQDQDQDQEQGPDQQPNEGEGGDQPQQLPQFEDQPDMTAEQAAAILEAVENLEREQRRKQAQEQATKRPRKGKDW